MDEENKKVETKGEESAGEHGAELKKENTFSQEDVNNIVAREVAKALKKATKSAPVENPVPGAASAPVEQEKQNTELISAKQELLLAKAQLEAYKLGISATAAEDAVYLAMRDAQEDGEADEDSIREALSKVLKRHPEWKPEEKQKGSFKIGADGQGAGQDPSAKKHPTGRVIL